MGKDGIVVHRWPSLRVAGPDPFPFPSEGLSPLGRRAASLPSSGTSQLLRVADLAAREGAVGTSVRPQTVRLKIAIEHLLRSRHCWGTWNTQVSKLTKDTCLRDICIPSEKDTQKIQKGIEKLNKSYDNRF